VTATTHLPVTSGPAPVQAPAGHRFRTGFRPDIEGLRAVAVLTVLAFHAGIPHLTGGFVGVDVFFVISGFLITGLMAAELTGTGRISLPAFYARRARRILPSAAIVLVASAIAGWFILPLLAVHDLAIDLVAAAGYVANWRFIAQGTNYLAPSTEHSPFLHYWSLAVEEQFYLVWPPLVIATAAVARRARLSMIGCVAGVLAVLTVASFAFAQWQTGASPGTAYLGTPARAWQFGVGALLALAAPQIIGLAGRRRAARVLGNLTGWAGLISIAAASTLFDAQTPYPGTASLAPTLGTAAIILAGLTWGVGGPSVGMLLSGRPVRAVGRLSFAWYLWHWPVLIFGEALLGTVGPLGKVALVTASAIPALLTMRLIERPIRFSRVIMGRTSSGLAIGATATVCALLAGLTVGSRAALDLGDVGSVAAIPSLAAVFDTGPAATRTHGAVTPSPLTARDDRPQPDACILQAKVVTGPPCRIGTPGGQTVVLFGDSHAQQWLPALQVIGADRGWSIVIITKSGCPVPALTPRANDTSEFSQPDCAQWRAASLGRIAALKPALIFVSALHNYVPDPGERLTAWNLSLDQLRQDGAPIVYLADTPLPGKDIPVCISGALDDWSQCAFPRQSALSPDQVVVQALTGRQQQLNVVDLTSYLCPTAICPAVRNGILLYRDDSHITATVSRVLAPAIEQILVTQKVLTPR
jgi:peptidoglycan/LPS O-acetylase OafA/YrhL